MSNFPDRDLKVTATAANGPEADLILQRLTQVGISGLSQRAIGGPEWGDSGSRYVYVHARDLDRARSALEDSA